MSGLNFFAGKKTWFDKDLEAIARASKPKYNPNKQSKKNTSGYNGYSPDTSGSWMAATIQNNIPFTGYVGSTINYVLDTVIG